MTRKFYPNFPDLSTYRFLLTGGAGFIGSHVLDFLVESNAGFVRVLDNLSTGNIQNISHHLSHVNVEFVEADICSVESCHTSMQGIDCVIHLAALGSVPRSISNPIATHQNNDTGFLNVIWAAKENGVKRVVYASSSSVYGDNPGMPKKEGHEGKPLSPYAFTKQANEAYAKLFFDLYGLETIGLRFFNVFGKRQNKLGPYAAFIPLVVEASLSGAPLTLYGDGTQSRDFTHVSNAVWAVKCGVMASDKAFGRAFNVACGSSKSLLEIVKMVEMESGQNVQVHFATPRKGDVKDSLADLSNSAEFLDYRPVCGLEEGLGNVLS
jgi:UDP-N-acetylglucosamine/UDP-N-acetylgalactosamine 4-epimerase